ncbi:ribonuclease HI [Wohlfahrtiimonas larvae]|uniref:Ribonuclease H n=2 Tax=Wohlfahrtiimonas larvae TaxID=1157986 RepID=A0ABP9MRQ9_9GAMM|nr:ribonuclease HI [Wohlfahrtiimonas larvae]
MMDNKVYIYTDGACSGNPGKGGWGVILKFRGHTKELSGYDPDTTNNRMELMGAIKGLQALKKPCDVVLITDSRYVQQGINEWVNGWIARGWKTASNQPVKNVELWKLLVAERDRHTSIDWQWVKGHAGHPENERADELATSAVKNEKGLSDE